MTEPTPEYLIETMRCHSEKDGYQKLRQEGYDVTQRQCVRIRRELRLSGKVVDTRQVWTDEMIEEVRRLAADAVKAEDIGKAMGRSTEQVYTLVRRLRIPLNKNHGDAISAAKGLRPAPPREELEVVYREHSLAMTAVAFQASTRVVKRWLAEYGIERPPLEKKPRLPRAPKPRKPKSDRAWGVSFKQVTLAPTQENGPVADAARYLRQQGYANVYRRSMTEWQVGARVMLEADMLARVDEMKARRARLAGVA